MRSTLRIAALILVLVVLLVPLVAYADAGPCPDDPVLSKTCAQDTPPYYVVTNRSVEYLYPERPGSGCQPFILENPDCKDCATDPECVAIDVEQAICMDVLFANAMPSGDVYEMCCACAADPAGEWVYRVRKYDEATGACPIDGDPDMWEEGLPPDTGIDLPAPIIVGGLALLGAALLAVGTVMRRRAPRLA
jgi:hypothetical protein